MKACSRCEEVRHEHQFHRCASARDGLQHWCKPCMRAIMPALHRAYYRTEAGQAAAKRAEDKKKTNATVVAKRRVRALTRKAIKAGKIPVPAHCEAPGCYGPAEHAHHPSYAKGDELKVVFLCTKCHGEEHRRINDAADLLKRGVK